MSLALGYLHQAFKRQADNRHKLLVQGLSLMLEYHECRQATGTLSERRESFFNMGRFYHMLGLTHLAVPYYERCLDLHNPMQQGSDGPASESFACEAALALQGIWAVNGDSHRAIEVTEKWLQI